MSLSIFDIFKVAIGPSSSHTVGPMKAAKLFLQSLPALTTVTRIQITLHGSLAFTGKGHGTDKALIWGLIGYTPEDINPDKMYQELEEANTSKKISLLAQQVISFDTKKHIIFDRQKQFPFHSNAMVFQAYSNDRVISESLYYSIGGGFVLSEEESHQQQSPSSISINSFDSAKELLNICSQNKKSISQITLENECQLLTIEQVQEKLMTIYQAMNSCIDRGLQQQGTLPGPMKIKRRAFDLYQKLSHTSPQDFLQDPLEILDWVNLYAIAVNEENAAGSKVVTAPTNGAAGIIPSVIRYYTQFRQGDIEGIKRFLLTSGTIGILYKKKASLSGAEVGCQGEVGVACSMAAGGLVEALGGTPEQVEQAAEIGMEHNLGLTCDPVGGLVQIPCIERNAMGAVKAINASRMAMKGDGLHHVSLDSVMKTMRETGEDMKSKYKETSEGGLAVNITEC